MTGVPRCALLLAPAFAALAQQTPFTLARAVQEAVEKYPATRVSLEQVGAAAASVRLVRTSYLPRADLLAQVNRATRNNVFGLMLPQPVLPAISGPVLNTNNLSSVWGSAVGVLVSWEPFDFGLRRANVYTAEAARRHAEAGVASTRLEVATAAADAFLTVLAAEQALRSARAAVERAQALERSVAALVEAQLRPGADASRARAERAQAEIQTAQAEQAAGVARAALSQLLAVEPSSILLDPGPLLSQPAAQPAPAEKFAEHPQAREQSAAVDEAKLRWKALERSYFPRFNLEAASYARGTHGGAAGGLAPDVQNWAVGMTVTFPVLELPALHAKKEVEAHRELAEEARYRQLLQDLTARGERAKAYLDGARKVADCTPVALHAAQATFQQAGARYRAGLGVIVEVAEAQRLLTQAEIDDSLARLNVWRAWLGAAAAVGDLEPFLRAAEK